MSAALFATPYILILLLPGIAVERLLFKDRALCVLAWIAVSYSIFALLFIVGNYNGISTQSLKVSVFSILMLSILSLTIKNPLLKSQRSHSRNTNNWLTPVASIVGTSLIYQLLFGVFTEVPADLYAHLERYQFAYANLLEGNLGPSLSVKQLLLQQSGVFYYLIGLSNSSANLDTLSLLPIVDFTNRTLFLLAVFFFAQSIFKEHPKQNLTAYLTTAFTALHMGINVFAYSRYYSLAPTMLAMPLYFFSVAIFLRHIYSPLQFATSFRNFGLIFLTLISTAAIHTQEALFIYLMLICLSVIASLSNVKYFAMANIRQRVQTTLISLVALILFVTFYHYSLDNFTRTPNAHWRLWDFGEGPWIFPQLTILNLKFQFLRVVTLWGLLVYVLFFLNIKRYRNNIFLLAGMLSPLVTFLNPFFVDTFLRHESSTTLWRLCYLLPIHFVGADLFVYYTLRVKQQNILKKVFSLIIAISLIGLLTPIKNTWLGAHYSRWPTLNRSEETLSSDNYIDLINYLDGIETQELILTDPVTGYMISALTKHKSPRRKFFRSHKYKHFSFKSYADRPLIKKYPDHLLIINKTAHPKSKIGDLSGHWSPYEWGNKKHYYEPVLLSHLTGHPNDFKLLWSDGEVSVYRIAPIEHK